MADEAGSSRRAVPADVDLLEIDPELFAGADPAALGDAPKVDVLSVDVGGWEPDALDLAEPGHLGLLVLDGVILRRTALQVRDGVEMLGPGDLLRPWVATLDHDDLVVRPLWSVYRRTRLALLDAAFAARVARWPGVTGELMDRLVRRQYALAIQLSITHTPNLQLRLRLVLWSLAGRWGRVTPDGIRVDVPLTHQLIADLAGASRPPVTTALGELERSGALLRDEAGRWLLRGAPPEEFAPAAIASSSPAQEDLDDVPIRRGRFPRRRRGDDQRQRAPNWLTQIWAPL
jgi:hypothetical protein